MGNMLEGIHKHLKYHDINSHAGIVRILACVPSDPGPSLVGRANALVVHDVWVDLC